MKSTIQTLDPTRVRLTVEVPLDELGFDLTRSRDQVAGFRVGQLPFSPIDQRMGATVLPQAVEQAIVTHAFAAAKQHDLRPLGRIEIEVPGDDQCRHHGGGRDLDHGSLGGLGARVWGRVA